MKIRYYGITSKPPIRRAAEWEEKGRDLTNFEVIDEDLYYEEAQEKERELLESCESKQCEKCEGHPGGQPVRGQRVYSVYTYLYNPRKMRHG